MRPDGIPLLVLAAGASRRMGRDKLLAPFAGVPLIRRLAAALAPLRPLVVGPGEVAGAVAGLPGVQVLATPRTAGMSVTLALGEAAAAPGPLLVTPGDLPFLDARLVGAFLAAAPGGADLTYPEVGGVPGHPVLWSPAARRRIAGLDPATPPMQLRRDPALRVAAVALDDPGYVTDVDTPEAWAAAEGLVERGVHRER